MQSMSERVHDQKFSKPKDLLQGVKGIDFVDFERPDECCGFGGTFSVTEEAVAAKMPDKWSRQYGLDPGHQRKCGGPGG
jgi:L-lactate dehydrogenase complex protein LldE